MPHLINYFDRIAIISLPHRSDRRKRLEAHLQQRNLASPDELTWVDGVDGNHEVIPKWWETGPGAWGCRESHLKVLKQAHQDDLENILILEDDAFFHHRTRQWLGELITLLPEDWDLFFLGGEHHEAPLPTHHERLLRGTFITRTHAYAINGQSLKNIITHVEDDDEYQAHPGWHIDHQYALYQKRGTWKAYAPAWWLAAQDEGHSNISCQNDERRWWQIGNHYWSLPFILHPDPSQAEEWIFQSEESPPLKAFEWVPWLLSIALQAWHQGKLPACSLNPEEITSIWPAGLVKINSQNDLDQLADYPANGMFSHSFNHS